MAESVRHAIGGGKAPVSALTEVPRKELAGVAGRHLADLIDNERRIAVERRALWFPRTRRFGRAILLGWLSVLGTFTVTGRWLMTPRHWPGRLLTRVKLFAPRKTFTPSVVLALGFVIVMGFLRIKLFADTPTRKGVEHHDPWQTITGALFTASLIGLLSLLWKDLVRLPFLAGRIRHRIVHEPERVLLPNLLAQQGRPLVEHLALDIVPRTELYDDLLPGVVARDRKDVQIVVGDAGAGKTTALFAVSQLLAQNGIVPVLVPLRSHMERKIIEPSRARFKDQVQAQVSSDAEADSLWRWLVLRRRVAILIDDIDQVGPDGERGLVMRTMLDEAEASGLSVIVTARPAGVPAGIAASAIDLGALSERDAIDHVMKRAESDPSSSCAIRPSRHLIAEWVAEGKLAEVPFYLELLAGLAAVGQCPPLPQAGSVAGAAQEAGRVFRRADGTRGWNQLWVRFRLLEHYHEQMSFGHVRRSLGIEPRERRSTLSALEDAALGTLAASSLAARMKLKPHDVSESESDGIKPLREHIQDFIATDDRLGLRPDVGSERRSDHFDETQASTVRKNVSAHEVIDAGERLGILDVRADQGTIVFHHRIMQAYLAARCLVRREYAAELSGRERINPIDRQPETERNWIAALLDHRHPDRLTAHMTLKFAAMRAREIGEARRTELRMATSGHEEGEQDEAGKTDEWRKIGVRIVEELILRAQEARKGESTDEDLERPSGLAVTVVTETEDEQTQLSLSLAPEHDQEPARSRYDEAATLDPLYKPDFERRCDPDDALMKLTTVAEIARAVPEVSRKDVWRHERWPDGLPDIAEEVLKTPGTTMWTQLRAIEALAVASEENEEDPSGAKKGGTFGALCGEERWHRIWQFARDRDYDVRRVASEALQENAYESFRALADEVDDLILRAAARSAYGRRLTRPEAPNQGSQNGDRANGGQDGADALDSPIARMVGADNGGRPCNIATWTESEDIRALKALAAVLPAIVSGFREDPSIELEFGWLDARAVDSNGGAERNGATGHEATASLEQGAGRDDRERAGANEVMCHRPRMRKGRLEYSRRASQALESLVALAFEGNHGDLEAAVAQGFRSDALRHALYPERNVSGPGWVSLNRELVAGVCLEHAGSWYARIALYQALALYAIAGADAQETFDVFATHMRRGGRDRHPFTQRAARLARAALRRSELRSMRWLAYVWGDEGKDTRHRAAQLAPRTAQLLADVTMLLNLNETSPEDRQDAFAHMQTLPYCLSGSRDRSEILGEGCPSRCGWGLCPYRQPPPDEPDAHRGMRRAFCRQQREIALRRRPPWQHAIHRGRLREFWREMETRART